MLKLTDSMVDILKEGKAEINERMKILRHYGTVGDLFRRNGANRFISTLYKLVGTNNQTGKSFLRNIPEELRADLQQINNFNIVPKNLFDDPPVMTFVSYAIPRDDLRSSELRLTLILKILSESNCKIDFLYATSSRGDEKYVKRFAGNIHFNLIPLNIEEYVKFVADRKPRFVWITELWRINYVQFNTELCQKLKERCPSVKIVVDTVDFHYKEFFRKYELTLDKSDLEKANEFLKNEKVLYKNADTVVVISRDEAEDIQNEIPNIAKIEIVPNIHHLPICTRPLHKRKHICFVGHFGNWHNVDAADYFIKEIWPAILEKHPDVEFHLVGHHSDKRAETLNAPNVRFIGGVKYLDEALMHYRLFVCPMRFGAGMKGKIGSAICAGLPVITTSIGAEGFPFKNAEDCFITDYPKEFADKCNQCLDDSSLWYNISIKSGLMLAQNFSPGVVAEKLKSVLSI